MKVDLDKREKERMRKREETVLYSCKKSEDKITRMKNKCMDNQVQHYAESVIIMLNYLEDKYGLRFEAVMGDIPIIHSKYYFIYARACEGEHAGEKFKVSYMGENGCRDNYISLLKAEELNEAFAKLIHKRYSDTHILTQIYGDYGYEINADSTGEQIMKEAVIGFDLLFAAPNMSSDEFDLRVADIVEYLNENCINSEGFIFCLREKVDLDMMAEDEKQAVCTYTKRSKWREYIVTRSNHKAMPPSVEHSSQPIRFAM